MEIRLACDKELTVPTGGITNPASGHGYLIFQELAEYREFQDFSLAYYELELDVNPKSQHTRTIEQRARP